VAEARQGPARLDAVTADLAEAVRDAQVVVVPLPATTHEDVAQRLGAHLTPEQVVLLMPGTLGSYAMARHIARTGGTLPYAFAETGTLPYLTRKTGDTTVAAPVRAANLPVGVFPSSRSKGALARIGELFPATRPCVDAVDVALKHHLIREGAPVINTAMLGAFTRASELVSLDNIEKALKRKLSSDAATLNFEVVRSAYAGTTIRKKT